MLASALLGACASQNVAVSSDTLATMQGKSLVLIQRESPSFVAMTSGKGMFAVAGVGAAALAGNKIVKENDIVDPAMTISRRLANGLVNEYGVALRGETDAIPTDKVDSLADAANDSDYALDVVTHGWSYMYDGFKMGDYFVGYSSKLRLIDVNRVKWSPAVCVPTMRKRQANLRFPMTRCCRTMPPISRRNSLMPQTCALNSSQRISSARQPWPAEQLVPVLTN